MNIIPPPKSAVFNANETILWRSFKLLLVSGLTPETFDLVKREFPGARDTGEKNVFRIRMVKSSKAEFPAVRVPQKPDAYSLRVTGKGIVIDAGSSSGLWSGLQTLAQLTEGNDAIPVCEISDYAAIRRRGIHWDLKGYQPKFPVLLEEFRRLAHFKVNMVLLELEDKYDFSSAPGVGIAGAYTGGQLRILSRHASALGITVIPKLQCLGHVDYLLKLPGYRHLREGKHAYQFCPRNDEAFTIWKKMAAELMECFSEHADFFHIGADETNKLGVCPKCSPFSKADTYIFHVNRCLDFIEGQGRMPLMWDDILRDLHGVLGLEAASCAGQGFVEKAILNYWAYGYGGKRNVFPHLHEYRKQNARVWGASGFSGCDNWSGNLPPMKYRAPNIDAWTKTAVENGLEAVIATGWTKIASGTPPAEPHETSWFTILYAAESMWSGGPRDYNVFIDALSEKLYGQSLPVPLRQAVMNITENPFDLSAMDRGLNGNPGLALLQYAAATESFAAYFARSLVASRQMFHGQFGKSMPDYIIEGRRNALTKFLADLNNLEANVSKYLEKFYENSTVGDFLRSRFGYYREYATEFINELDKTRES